MDNALFLIIAISAVAGFLIGILDGWWSTILVSLILAGLILWLFQNLR